MHTDDDFMEVGALVPLKNGWYLDTETNTKFKLDEDGNPIDELGLPAFEELFGDDIEVDFDGEL